jgi:CxxC motif-containing protein
MAESSKNVIKVIRCIVCPTGCSIKVIGKDDKKVSFEGYTCNRGLEYAEQEFREPKRILTTTMKVENGALSLIPVRTDKPLLKDKLNEALEIIAQSQIKAPIKMGDILIENILDMGINIIASRNLEKSKA